MNRFFYPLLILLCFSMVQCTKKKTKVQGDVLNVALASMPATLEPTKATDAYGMRIASLIFSSLVRVDDNLKPVGDAAEDWSYKNKTFTFRLKSNIRFHDGSPVTREDIVYSFAQFKSVASPFAPAFKDIVKVDVSEKNGRLIVAVTLKEYSAKLLTSDLPALKIMPRNRVEGSLVGSGPFKFSEKTDNSIVLARNAEHFDTVPLVTGVTFRVIRDDLTRVQKLLKGEVDLAQAEIPNDKLKSFSKDNFLIQQYPGLSMTYLLINFNDPVLKNKKIREAIDMSISRGDIIKYKMAGLGEAATSLMTPQNPFFFKDLKSPEQNIDEAKKIISELKLDGTRLLLKTSNVPVAVDNGKVLANQISQTGLKIDLQSLEWGVFYGDVSKGRFQLAILRWVGSTDPDLYRLAFHSLEKPPGRNRGSYSNEALDKLLDQGISIEDMNKRIKLYNEVQKIVYDDLAIIPLWYDMLVALSNKRVLNYKPSPMGDYWPFVKIQLAK